MIQEGIKAQSMRLRKNRPTDLEEKFKKRENLQMYQKWVVAIQLKKVVITMLQWLKQEEEIVIEM